MTITVLVIDQSRDYFLIVPYSKKAEDEALETWEVQGVNNYEEFVEKLGQIKDNEESPFIVFDYSTPEVTALHLEHPDIKKWVSIMNTDEWDKHGDLHERIGEAGDLVPFASYEAWKTECGEEE